MLEKKLKMLQEQLHMYTIFDDVESQILTEEKTKGAILRCKANWLEAAEKPTKYFTNLEKE